VRIMAARAIGLFEGLVLVSFLQIGALHIVTVDAQRRRRLRQVIVELRFADLAYLCVYGTRRSPCRAPRACCPSREVDPVLCMRGKDSLLIPDSGFSN